MPAATYENKCVRVCLAVAHKVCACCALRPNLHVQLAPHDARRMEVNSFLSFTDLTEAEFESIMRRSCVVKIAARMFDKQYLDRHLPNHEDFGIFARDPTFSKKFTTTQYAAAWNRTQHVFESQRGQAACRDLIVEYTRGGKDQGMTERFMRRSCHLEPTGNQQDTGDVAKIAGVAVEVDAAKFLLKGPETVDESLRAFAVALMRETCDRGLEAMTQSYFYQRKRKIEGSSLGRQELWGKLPSTGLWRAQVVKAQHKDGQFRLVSESLSLRNLSPSAIFLIA